MDRPDFSPIFRFWSKVSEFTGPTAEATAEAETDLDESADEDDAKGAEAAADEAERIAAESSPEPEAEPKKARPPAKSADPGAGCSDAAIRAFLGRWPASVRSKLTKRLERLLNRLEEPDSGVEAAAKAGFDLPERSTDTGPKHALLADGKVVSVFKKGAFGKFDFKACQEPSDDFTELALSTFGKKKRKAAAAGPPAKKAPAAAGAAKSRPIAAIFGKPGAGAGKPEPTVADAARTCSSAPRISQRASRSTAAGFGFASRFCFSF